ncbi:ComEA family DNA-binding protein [Nocardia tengchongensis]|uniref:ComEA family DNA-binding protein n=1 Tax=Nocardia tengchongensis TaxID=2055889 RepID=UPI00368B1965
MPQLDERTPLQRLSSRAGTEPRPLEAETGSGPAPFASAGLPHAARWDEESLDNLLEPDHSDPACDHPEPAPPVWLSEPCGPVSLWHERLVPERFRGTRWDPGPRGVLVIAALGLLAILIAGYVSLRETPVSQPVPPIAALTEPLPADQGSPPAGAAAAPGADPAAPDAAGPGPVAPGAAVPLGGSPVTVVPGAAASSPSALRVPGRADAPQPGRNPAGPTATAVPAGTAVSAELVVSVVGLVEHGGLRRFPSGARVADALRAAAPRPEADLSTLNLAQPLTDGDQIVIARTAARPTPQQAGSTIVNSAHPVAVSPSSPGPPRPTAPAAKVNLNTATETELDTLPGVGPVTAKAILTWRARHGRFTSVDQLSEIDGIGHSRLTRLRDRVTV